MAVNRKVHGSSPCSGATFELEFVLTSSVRSWSRARSCTSVENGLDFDPIEASTVA